MLQAIRSKAGSFVVKALFALLILTFGIWGIGDIFRNRGAFQTDPTKTARALQSAIDATAWELAKQFM